MLQSRDSVTLMPDAPAVGEVTLEVISPDRPQQRVRVTEWPFFIGRGEVGNHLAIPDKRISRQCAAIVAQDGHYYLEDRGHHAGIFINGKKTAREILKDGDVVSFGLDDAHKLIFRSSEGDAAIQTLLTRMETVDKMDITSGGMGKLNLLLEATRLLHSQLPLDAVLEAMLDRAIAVTDADRALLLEADASGALRQRLARRSGATSLAAEGFSPSQTAVGLAVERQTGVITDNMHQAEGALQGAQSIVAQRLRSVVAIPLYSMPRANTEESMARVGRGHFLGVLYLDSRRPAAFSKLDRQILDAIAIESASILDNARLVEHERERQRIEQELGIARNIQQALLPREFRDFPHLGVSGMNRPCLEVGGDYFDVFPMGDERTAFLIADVAGKGLGAALLTTMLQGALSGMTMGAKPARVFQHINEFLCEHGDTGRYATLFFGMLDARGNLEYFNAGHPSPLLLRHGKVTPLFTEGSVPVGLVPEAKHPAARAKLEPGDTLVLFSDGVTEAEDADKQLFGVKRLEGVLAGQQDAPLEQAAAEDCGVRRGVQQGGKAGGRYHASAGALSRRRTERQFRDLGGAKRAMPESGNQPIETPKKIGRYEILAELGRGAMGTVYRAKDPAMDRVVALKTIISVVLASEQGSEFRERFYREARAAGALAHPGIVPVFDVGEHEGMPFLVMEFVTGRTLADTAKQGERLSLDRVCEIGQKIAEALGYAHQHGVVHRDIKPANILLTSREMYGIERPKITDFGVAKLAEGQTTLTGQMVGTPAFMPPEQFTGAPIDRRADIFSLGVVLYWMATGEQPFPGESMTAVSYKVVHTEPVPPRKLNPSVPAKLESVILKCLAKSPEDRYQTGEELARELDTLRTGDKGKLQSAAPARAAAESDPDATLIGSAPMAAAGAAAAMQQPGRTGARGGKHDNRLMLAAVIMVAVAVTAAAGVWYAVRSRQKSVVQPAVQAAVQAVAPPPATTSATPVAETAETHAPNEVAGTPKQAPKTPPKKTPAKTAPASAGVAPEKPADATAEAKVVALSPPKPAEAAPEPAAVGFDPKKLDRKQNAKLEIDAERMPASVDFTVLMNGKVYLQKTGAKSNLGDEEFYVPPGVQEFRVKAKSGAVEKTSNTVSTEFLAKKRNTLRIEARSKGMPPGSGMPQGLYPDTEIVVTLK